MDSSVSYQDALSSVIIYEDITGGASDTNYHGGRLDVHGLIGLQGLLYIKVESALCELQLDLLSLLGEFGSGVLIKGDYLVVIKALISGWLKN